MYFGKTLFNEYGDPVEVELICNKCGKIITITDISQFSNISSDYCVVKDKSIISCDICNNRCQVGLVEYKKMVQYNNCIINNSTVQSNIPRCPTCGSTNIKSITGSERAVSILGLGVFSKKINKSYKCLNCKCTW